MDSPFGVLHKPYCNYFVIIGYFWLILSIISVIMSLFFLYKGVSSTYLRKQILNHFYVSLFPIVAYFILYFQNRLFYSMCIRSLS